MLWVRDPSPAPKLFQLDFKKMKIGPLLFPEKFLMKPSENREPPSFLIDRYDAYLLGWIQEKDLRTNRTFEQIRRKAWTIKIK